MIIALPYEVVRVRRSLDPEPNELGNEQWTTTRETVPVAGWAQPTSTEPKLAGHDRLVVDMELYAPIGTFQHDDDVEIPGEDPFQVIGQPENYSKSPFGFDPGLEVVNLRRTDG